MKKTHNDSLAPKKQEQVELADIFHLYADDCYLLRYSFYRVRVIYILL